MKKYMLDEWTPNIPLLLLSVTGFVIILWYVNDTIGILTAISFVLFGWSFAFATRKESDKNEPN